MPQYRFHYYLQENKAGDNKPHVEYKTGENIPSSLGVTHSRHSDVQIVSYRTDKSNGLQSDSNTDTAPYKILLNNPLNNSPEKDASNESIVSSEASPIVVEQITIGGKKLSASVEQDFKNEYQKSESVSNITQLIEPINTNHTEDRNDDLKDEHILDQVSIQDHDLSTKQTDFTIPFKTPNSVHPDDFKYINEEAMKQNIVNKVIQNINGDHEQFNSQLNFKSTLSDKPIKIVGADSMDKEQQENYQSSHGHSNFKSQQLSNKPLRLFGYNPSVFGSLYDMQINYNRPSQVQQSSNSFNQGYTTGYGVHSDDVRPQTQPQIQPQVQSQPQFQSQAYDSSGMYISQPISTFQTGSHKVNQKLNAPTPTQPFYYYDPISMSLLPIYTNMVQNSYSTVENKPSSPSYTTMENKPSPIAQADSSKNGFNLLQILSGGSFYKGSEQAEVSQQTTIKDPVIKQESNKLEKAKPLDKAKPLETIQDKTKPTQTLMFYLHPGDLPIDLKSFTLGQQSQADCNGQTHKAPELKVDRPLQPIPLCTDCKPALALMGLPSTKSTVIQQKKSIIGPQVMPIWNGLNTSKLNYLILPNPITK